MAARRARQASGTRGVPHGRSLSKKLGEAIVKDIREGLPSYTASEAHGVPRGTFVEWVRRGEGRDDRPATPLLTWFAGEVEKAKAERTQRRVRLIERHGEEDWKPIAWLLERTDPENWGQRAVVAHQGGVDHRVIVELAFDHTPMLAAVQRRRLEAGGVIDVEPSKPKDEETG